jgi:GntR family transcriptional regulator
VSDLHTVGKPIAYRALAQDLTAALARGDFADGRLPTEAELGERYRVSRQTVRRALHDLVTEGLVFRVRGRGTFATQPTGSRGGEYLRSFGSIDDLLALSEDTLLETVVPLGRRADVAAASRMHLPSDEVVTGLFRRLHADAPFCVTEVFLPLELGQRIMSSHQLPGPGEANRRTLIGLVEEMAAEPIVVAHQSVTACPLPDAYVSLIACEPNQAVLRIDRLYLNAKGESVELAISHFDPNRYSYRLELRRSIR